MSSPANSLPVSAALPPRPSAAATTAAATAVAPAPFSTPALLAAMLKVSLKISDLFFTPGKPPLVEIGGRLAPAGIVRNLSSDDTRRIAIDLFGSNQQSLAENLKERGILRRVLQFAAGAHRFRVNVFAQRGTCAVVMRVIPGNVPTFRSAQLAGGIGEDCWGCANGIVLVTGPTGSGKSSTLAAIIDKINREQCYHVLHN